MVRARADNSPTHPRLVTRSSEKKGITGQKSAPTQKLSKKKLNNEYAEKEAVGEDNSDYSEPKGEITYTSVLKCQIKPVLCKIIHIHISKCCSSDFSVSFKRHNYLC